MRMKLHDILAAPLPPAGGAPGYHDPDDGTPRSACRFLWVGEQLTRPIRHACSIPSNTIVARTEGYTYAASVWASRCATATAPLTRAC
jgi:hypothetical protein